MITVIYYTSNREKESFERKIRQRLLDVIGDLPLISVSQYPIDFGHNICVGNIGTSDRNVYRQLLIGCMAAKTPLVATAEADCLYPPTGYFDFIPEKIDYAYRYTNLWLMLLRKGNSRFEQKAYSLCAQISGREYLIHSIKRRLRRSGVKDIFWRRNGWEYFTGTLPCINIKTGYGMRSRAGTTGDPVQELPYWGSAEKLKAELFGEDT